MRRYRLLTFSVVARFTLDLQQCPRLSPKLVMSYYTLYTDTRKIKMKEEQLNLKCISQIFRFFPDSIILVADDGSVEFPDEQGNFSLASYLSYQVQGDSLAKGPAPCTINSSPLSLPSTSAARAPVRTPRGISIKAKWPSKPPAVAAKECTEWTKSIEVNQVTNGELKKFSNFPIILSEPSATILHISQQLSCEVFAGKKVILLDNDNLPIPDTTASRGMK